MLHHTRRFVAATAYSPGGYGRGSQTEASTRIKYTLRGNSTGVRIVGTSAHKDRSVVWWTEETVSFFQKLFIKKSQQRLTLTE